jgi:hypothetical protein
MSTLSCVVGATAAVGLALAMVAPRAGARAAGLLLCLAGCLTLALELAPDGHAGLYAVVGGAGAAVAVGLAALFARVPWALPLVALACVPFAVDVHVGRAEGRLLVPLYAVAAGAALALLWRPRRERDLGLVAWPLALFVGLIGVSLLWSDDSRAGATTLVLFVLPFGVLALALARLPWREGWSRLLAVEFVGLALGLAIAAGVQYLTRDVSAVIGGSVVSDWYYPVGPVLDEPGDYARFVAVALVVAVALAVRARGAWAWAPALLAAIALWLGLAPSFSQAAFVAVGVATLALLIGVWSPRSLVPAAVVLTLGAAVAGSFAVLRRDVLDTPGPSAPASVYDAIQAALDHPVAGLGVAAAAVPNAAVAAAVGLGLGGLLLLAAVVVAALGALRGARGPAGFAIVAALVAIAVDSIFRGELLRDPLFWGVLGLAAAAARPAPPVTPGRRPSAAPYNRPLEPLPARSARPRAAGRDRIGVRLRRVAQARAQPDPQRQG